MSFWRPFCRAIEAPAKILGSTIAAPLISMGALTTIKEYLHYVVPPQYLLPILITSAVIGCVGSSLRVTACGRKIYDHITRDCCNEDDESDEDDDYDRLLTLAGAAENQQRSNLEQGHVSGPISPSEDNRQHWVAVIAKAEEVNGNKMSDDKKDHPQQTMLIASSRPHLISLASDPVVSIREAPAGELAQIREEEVGGQSDSDGFEDPSFNVSDNEEEQRRSKNFLRGVLREF